jgi:tRNA(fMet)-specific endonuclease VapC
MPTIQPTQPNLVVDTDVASFVFKWHPTLAPQYLKLLRGCRLVMSFMTVAEMRQGAMDANWGARQRQLLDDYLGEFFILHSNDSVCSRWASIRNESRAKGRVMGAADAWIAAAALDLNASLVTHNHKHFLHLDGLTLVSISQDA